MDREIVLDGLTQGCGFSLRGECPVYILSVAPGASLRDFSNCSTNRLIYMYACAQAAQHTVQA